MKRNTKTGSQHFLRSPLLVERLVKRVGIKQTDVVYDIGAGSGVITSVLARYAKKVIAIEIDPKTVSILRNNVHTVHRFENVEVVEHDFLTTEPPQVPYKVFANIPFHISSAIVQRFFNSAHSPEAAYLIVQKQFGQKLVSSESGRFTSQLGMLIGAEYAVRVVTNLQRDDFMPRPAVDTVLVALEKRKAPLIPDNELTAYKTFTERCFADQKYLSRQPLEVIGATAGLSPSRLTLSQWIILFTARKK